MARDEATYAERQAKANASLTERQKKMQEEADGKVKLIRQDLAKDITRRPRSRRSASRSSARSSRIASTALRRRRSRRPPASKKPRRPKDALKPESPPWRRT